ncbi:uncharacterized protein LOC121917922, partial [Sceloporus undulatus]|uniref:uncharacterized protein LOC121917922 n=1 Tax=Sceloporus undulatus TaxID=8520 RepID=UPI001C4D059E
MCLTLAVCRVCVCVLCLAGHISSAFSSQLPSIFCCKKSSGQFLLWSFSAADLLGGRLWPAMTQRVTYAELQLARGPPPQKGPNPQLAPGGREGELTYENVQGGPRGQGSEETPKENQESDRRMKNVGLVVAATIFFLLATTVALGVLYGQVSGELWWSSKDHADHRSVLAQRVSALNQSLAEMEIQLCKAEKDLNGTRLALKESQAARERNQRLLEKVEGQLRDANRNMEAAKQEKERSAAALRQAASLLQK